MSLNSKLITQIIADYTDPLDLTTPRDSLNFDKRLRLSSGVGANENDLLWHDRRTVNAAADDDLDLAGVLVDAFGANVNFAIVKGLVIAADVGNGDVIQVGGAAANQFVGWVADATDIVQVRPGGLLALFAPDLVGYPVTGGASDVLGITNADAGAAATYDVIILGVSA